MKQVLVLGAGLVARPLVDYLMNAGYKVLVATRTVSKAERIVGEHPNGMTKQLDIQDHKTLEKLVSGSDLVISLLPYIHHVTVAKLCLKHQKHMVTTSYVSEAMKVLDVEAKQKGVLLLNEIGLDPGIDHMSAMKIIHEVEDNGGEIISFTSYCGGLPAPEANTNPWGYKFSWSPRGVVMAAKNDAQFLQDGKVVRRPGTELFHTHESINIQGIGDFEGYPNRNSVPYVDIYDINSTKTLLRGTLRNKTWCEVWTKLGELGILDDNRKLDLKGKTYLDFLKDLTGGEDLHRYLDVTPDARVMENLRWLGMLEPNPIPLEEGTAMDVFCHKLEEKLTYGPGERDMIVLKHTFIAQYPDHKDRITSTFIDYGIPNGDTAMSRTVAYPAAIGARMILEGKITERGVHIPIKPNIYEPVLEELENMGMEFIEKTERVE